MKWMKDYNLILASGSPRRKELLEEMGFEFEVKTAEVDESYGDNLSVIEIAQYIAKEKFIASLGFVKDVNDILITADTIVVWEDMIMEKPDDLTDAKKKLMNLSNAWHSVITGVCIGNAQKNDCFSVTSKVFVEKISDSEIDYYLNNYRVLDKAGAYGIQEWFGLTKISKIEGSYTNIVGLPTQMLYKRLKLLLN